MDVLGGLLTAVPLGTISREDATTIRSIADTYLKHLGEGKNGVPASGLINVEALRNFAHEQPALIDVIEPLLSDEQLQEILVGTDKEPPG
jgi:hypothetical protein